MRAPQGAAISGNFKRLLRRAAPRNDGSRGFVFHSSELIKLQRFSAAKQVFILTLALGLWGFIIYIRWFATPAELRFIGTVGIDKIAHIAGGVFIAALAEWRLKRANFSRLALLLLGITISWEVLEFLFDAETKFFYNYAPNLWMLDSSGDIIAAILGGYGYWVFLRNRNASITEQLHGSKTDQIRV